MLEHDKRSVHTAEAAEGALRSIAMKSMPWRKARSGAAATSSRTVEGRSQDRKAWRFGWGFIAAGLVAIAVSPIFLSEHPLNRSSWANAVTSLAAGLALAGVVLLVERHLVREVSEALEEHTSDMRRERLEHLESLREFHATITADRDAAARALMDNVSNKPDYESVAELLERAQDLRFFDDLVVRSGTDRSALMNVAWVEGHRPANPTDPDWSDLELMEYLPDHIQLSAASPSGEVVASSDWMPAEPLTRAWNDYLDACVRGGVDPSQFDPAVLFPSLAASFGTMLDARGGLPGDSRLQGRLRLLINEQWAITNLGLESRIHSFRLESRPDREEPCPAGHDERLWREALIYADLMRDQD